MEQASFFAVWRDFLIKQLYNLFGLSLELIIKLSANVFFIEEPVFLKTYTVELLEIFSHCKNYFFPNLSIIYLDFTFLLYASIIKGVNYI